MGRRREPHVSPSERGYLHQCSGGQKSRFWLNITQASSPPQGCIYLPSTTAPRPMSTRCLADEQIEKTLNTADAQADSLRPPPAPQNARHPSPTADDTAAATPDGRTSPAADSAQQHHTHYSRTPPPSSCRPTHCRPPHASSSSSGASRRLRRRQ